MKVLSWNIRGLNNPLKQKEIRRLVRSLNISVVCLDETRVQECNALSILGSMFPGWKFFNNYSMHRLGKVWLCQDPGISSVSLVDAHSQVLTCMVHLNVHSSSWLTSTVYGANQGIERRSLWRRLEFLKRGLNSFPWLLVGDFNAIRSHKENWGGGGLSCYDIEFDDLAYCGCLHTWSNKQSGLAFISKKLDRVLANIEWIQKFGNTSVDFLEAGISDHSPALIEVEKYVSFGPKPFKFFNFWADHKLFLQWVEDGWKHSVEGYSMLKLFSKLKAVKKILKVKNLEIFGGLRQKVNKAKNEPDLAQSAFIASHGDEDCLKNEKECLHAYISLTLAEENFLKQKARNNWLNLGDGNTYFFHKSIKLRNAANLVKVLKDDEGNRVEDWEQIKAMAVGYYQKLLGSTNHDFSSEKADRITKFITRKFSSACVGGMAADVTKEEIQKRCFL